jgi:ubiquitin carboxyl-terminal hydrolase 4/11/15
VIQIENCFKEYGVEELLTGTDQWYCSKCKEHRDIHKKLELYRVPKILMLQIKRFQSKKSANNGKSGFFNLAYAQICQQEKVSELVEFPLEGLDIEPYVR